MRDLGLHQADLYMVLEIGQCFLAEELLLEPKKSGR